jgi:hypothetical protein
MYSSSGEVLNKMLAGIEAKPALSQFKHAE